MAQEWTILYHPGNVRGRAEFMSLIFEDAGVPYIRSSKDLYGPEGVMDAFGEKPENIKKDRTPYPIFFPPALWHKPPGGEEVMINQVYSIMQYIGDVLPGYAPSSAVERAKMSHIALNALDLLGEGRNSFHPKDFFASYNTQKEEALVASKKFASGRLLMWLTFLDKCAAKAGHGKPVAGGPNVTMADFVLFQVVLAVEAQFNNETYDMVWDQADVPALKAFKKAMEARPNLKAYLASDRVPQWAGDSMM